jgi:hypothetical protein
LKTLHILFATVAIDLNISYGMCQVRAAHEPSTPATRCVASSSWTTAIANPSYAGLLTVGILLVLLGRTQSMDISASHRWPRIVAAAALAFALSLNAAAHALMPVAKRGPRA